MLYQAIVSTLLWVTLLATTSLADDASPIVIVHGAWGGAHHWKMVDQSLTHDHGHTVRRVSLTGLGERSHLASRAVNLETHVRDVINTIEFDDLQSVILVAHSYGGVVAQGVVDRIPDRIARVVYIDSHLLDDGECYLTHHRERGEKWKQRANEDGDGWLIPVDWNNPMRDTPHPIATLLEPIKLSAAGDAIEATYWLLADGKPPEKDERYRYYQRAMDRGMTVRVFPWNHNPHRENPDDLVRELVASW